MMNKKWPLTPLKGPLSPPLFQPKHQAEGYLEADMGVLGMNGIPHCLLLSLRGVANLRPDIPQHIFTKDFTLQAETQNTGFSHQDPARSCHPS